MVLEVYGTLWLALLGMSFSAFCFSNTIALLILRKRFAQPPAPVPLQKGISIGLNVALGLFSLFWVYAFWTGAKAVVRAMTNEDFIPLLFLAFSPPFTLLVSWILFRISMRARSEEVAQLSEEIHMLDALKIASDDWSDAWRTREMTAMKAQLAETPERIAGWLQDWRTKGSQRFRGKALRVVLLLGKPDYHVILSMLEKNNREDIQRWSLMTGKDIPRWK